MAEAVVAPLSVRDRVTRIYEACITPLGFAMRGVTSWEQEWLEEWGDREFPLSNDDEFRLQCIERQVFGREWCG